MLCRIFQKSGLGPPNGDRYAPFIEEEWGEDAALVIPGGDAEDDVANGDEALVQYTDLDQVFYLILLFNKGSSLPLGISPFTSEQFIYDLCLAFLANFLINEVHKFSSCGIFNCILIPLKQGQMNSCPHLVQNYAY